MAMSAAVASSLISGGAGLLGSLGNMFSQMGANDKNIQIARENRDFYYQQWMRENAYNDPSAMMQRLARAGLNPNLMYGDGASGLPAAASMPSVEAARVSAPQVDPLVMAQAANIAADTMLKKSQVDKTESDIKVNEGVVKVNESVALYNNKLVDMTKYQQDQIIAQTKLIGQQIQEVNSSIQLHRAQIDSLNEQTKLEQIRLNIESDKVQAEMAKIEAETNWTKEQTKYYAAYLMAQVANLNADTVLKNYQQDLTAAQRAEVIERGIQIRLTSQGIAFNNALNYAYGETIQELKVAEAGISLLAAFDGHLGNKLSGGQLAGQSLLKHDKGNIFGSILNRVAGN